MIPVELINKVPLNILKVMYFFFLFQLQLFPHFPPRNVWTKQKALYLKSEVIEVYRVDRRTVHHHVIYMFLVAFLLVNNQKDNVAGDVFW